MVARSAFEIAQGYFVGGAVAGLMQAGVLDDLRQPATAAELAARHGLDPETLAATLTFLAAATEVILAEDGRFRLADPEASQPILYQYLGAYGAHAAELARLLCDPTLGPGLIDRAAHGRAYAGEMSLAAELVADILAKLGATRVLDLGCGSGRMLTELARRAPGFIGWGLDVAPAMVAEARAAAAAEGATDRLGFFDGDVRDVASTVPAETRAAVETLAAVNVANEFFAGGPEGAQAWLADLRGLFPDRTMLIGDYYGQLRAPDGPRRPEIALHDYAQILSGQGTPPATLEAWQAVYAGAGCRLVNVLNDPEGVYFVHVLRL